MNFRVRSMAGAGVMLIVGAVATAQQPQSPPPDPAQQPQAAPKRQRGTASRSVVGASDQRFIERAARAGQAEVEFGRMAVEKASNPKVKEFGQRMVDEHGRVNTELEDLAKKKGITLSASYPKGPMETRLSKLSGAAFDKAYMHDVAVDHEKEIAAFEAHAKSSTDPDVKDFAGRTVPALRAHLEAAKQIRP